MNAARAGALQSIAAGSIVLFPLRSAAPAMFKAIYLSKVDDQFHAEVRELDDATLEANTAGTDVTVDIDYSTINYKDGLALTNRSPVVRKWPMVPGIDCAGTVVSSTTPAWTAGDKVVLNGWGIGETAWGGLAQRGRYRGDLAGAHPGTAVHARHDGDRHRGIHGHARLHGHPGRRRRRGRCPRHGSERRSI